MSAEDSPFVQDRDGNLVLNPWDSFVLGHTNPVNIAGHFVSFLMFWGCPAMALITWNPWWLLAWCTSGFIGIFSHYISGEGDVKYFYENTSPFVSMYVSVMFYKIACRTYASDISDARGRLAQLEALNPSEPVR